MKKTATIIMNVLALCLVFSGLALGDELKGLITGRSADTMSVKTADGSEKTVLLTDDTKVQMPKGLGLRKQQVAWTSLLPGLQVKVKGTTNAQGQLVASEVEFSKESLRMASTIQAGLQPTQRDVEENQKNIAENQQNIAENQQNIATNTAGVQANAQQIVANAKETNDRFNSLADYDVKKEMTIYFRPGISALSAQDKAALSQMAAGATKLNGYLIEVKGFADSSGNAAMNQTLSEDRAQAAINYLLQNCKVPARRVLAPAAMGISNPAASNETAQGRKENRRVEVKVLVNKGISGSAGD